MQKILGLSLIGVVAIGALVYATGTFAAQQNYGPNYSLDRHEKMLRAFENNDYTAWKAQMGDRGPARVVTKENFPRFTEMHKLMLEGKTAEANVIRAELGLDQRGGQGRGMMNRQRGQNRGVNFMDANGDGICDQMQ